MKKLLIVPNFSPARGGSHTLYYNICRTLNPQEIVVFTGKTKGYREFDKKQKFKIYRTRKVSMLDSLVFKELLRLNRLIRKEKIKKILFGHLNSCLTALAIKFIFGKNYYLYVLAEEVTGIISGSRSGFFKKKCLKHAKGIIAISDYTKNLIKKYNKNIKIIYPAAKLDKFKPKQKSEELMKKHGLKNKKVILTLARLDEGKGHGKIIKLLPKLIKEHPSLKYLIVGEGEEGSKLRRLVSDMNLNKHVTFAGEVPEKELVDYYNLCDIFAMPNRPIMNKDKKTFYTEGFGIVFLEANACGKPVIGGNSGGVPSAITHRHNGLLVNGNDEKDIYNSLNNLLEKKRLREKLGKNGLEWARRFNYKKIAAELEEFIS